MSYQDFALLSLVFVFSGCGAGSLLKGIYKRCIKKTSGSVIPFLLFLSFAAGFLALLLASSGDYGSLSGVIKSKNLFFMALTVIAAVTVFVWKIALPVVCLLYGLLTFFTELKFKKDCISLAEETPVVFQNREKREIKVVTLSDELLIPVSRDWYVLAADAASQGRIEKLMLKKQVSVYIEPPEEDFLPAEYSLRIIKQEENFVPFIKKVL